MTGFLFFLNILRVTSVPSPEYSWPYSCVFILRRLYCGSRFSRCGVYNSEGEGKGRGRAADVIWIMEWRWDRWSQAAGFEYADSRSETRASSTHNLEDTSPSESGGTRRWNLCSQGGWLSAQTTGILTLKMLSPKIEFFFCSASFVNTGSNWRTR